MEAPATCIAGMTMSAPAKLVLQVSCASGLMPAYLIPVLMEVPVPLWPTSSPANASQASPDRSVRLMSMSVTFQDSASMVAPASIYRVPISASAPRASLASTVTAPMCPVHPPPVLMVAPAGRLVTSHLNATAFQVLKGSPVSGILMTALTTSVRMEVFVWMGLILTTAAVPLSGQDSSAQRMWMSVCYNLMLVRMEAPVPTAMGVMAVYVLMAGVEMTAVRTLMTVPLPPAPRAPPALTVWPPSLACAQKERQVYYVIWMMHASAILATRGHCVIPTP